MDHSEKLVEIRNVSRVFGSGADRIDALHHVSLDVAEGEFVALMGPSGSGKSTLLNLAAGLDRPTEGEVIVQGQDIAKLSERAITRWRASNVGLVFQFFNLMPALTARDNVVLPLLLARLGRSARRERAETALRVVGLGERLKSRPGQLSGGEQQRVAIARAIVTDPSLIVADEPTGNLDAKNARAILDLLGILRTEFNKTILGVTHDDRALDYVDRAIHLDKGVLGKSAAGAMS